MEEPPRYPPWARPFAVATLIFFGLPLCLFASVLAWLAPEATRAIYTIAVVGLVLLAAALIVAVLPSLRRLHERARGDRFANLS